MLTPFASRHLCDERTNHRTGRLQRIGFAALAVILALVTASASSPALGEELETTYEPVIGRVSTYYGTFPGFRAPMGQPTLLPSQRDLLRAPARDPADGPKPTDSLGETEQIQQRLAQRYGNPVVRRFVQSTSLQRGSALYQETARLIDTRHLQPTTYEARVKQAVRNLSLAVETPAFLQASQINPPADRVRNFQESLQRLAASRPVRSAADALTVMNGTIDLAAKQLGLRPTAVIAEYVYGAVESLDKYSAFEPENGPRQPSAAFGLEDHVVGIGVEIKPDAAGVLVVKALPGSPAAAAGLQANDLIVAINGRSLQGQTLEFAVDQITGPVGSRLTVTIRRDGRQLAPVTLTRSRIAIPSVTEVKLLGGEDRVGYLKLEKFAESSEREMDQALWSLHRQGMKSLIVDLRGNPGGLLTTAVALSDKFLASGPIVSTRGRTTADQSLAQARYENTWKIPLVVLVDSESASASEIFAAAIQENNRGLVVGHKTFGKGTVQTHFPLTSVSGNLRLTTATFHAPSGRPMAEMGVQPDIRLDDVLAGLGGRLTEELVMSIAVNMARSEHLQRLADRSTQPALHQAGYWPLGR